MEDISKGHTQIPHLVMNLIPFLDLTERESRAFTLILRLTYGCHGKWAKIIQADLKAVRIQDSHAKGVLEGLLSKQAIIQNDKTLEYGINEEYLASDVTKGVSFELEILNRLIHKQLSKAYSKSKSYPTDLERSNFPEEEGQASQFGKATPLPYKEVSGTNEETFGQPKDKINIVKKNYIYEEDIYNQIISFWNSFRIVEQRSLDDEIKKAIDKLFRKEYRPNEIMQAVENYAEIRSGEEYYYTYRLTLFEFLKEPIYKFFDGEAAREGFRRNDFKKKEDNTYADPSLFIQ